MSWIGFSCSFFGHQDYSKQGNYLEITANM